MRTVTFADIDLVTKINSTVIPVWNNQNPQAALGLKNAAAIQPKPTRQQIDVYPQGGGGGNMRAYFCTPEGKVFHYVQGYWSSKNFANEIAFAIEQFAIAKENSSKMNRDEVIDKIKRRSTQMKQQQAVLIKQHPEEFSKPVRQSNIRKRHAAIGLKIAANDIAMKTVGQDIKAVLTEILRQNLMLGVIQ